MDSRDSRVNLAESMVVQVHLVPRDVVVGIVAQEAMVAMAAMAAEVAMGGRVTQGLLIGCMWSVVRCLQW
jgi:hypothetical protein